MIDDIFKLSGAICYVAIYRHGQLQREARPAPEDGSKIAGNPYAETIVNPTLLTLATQRGELDCGGLDYVIVRYGNFFELVLPIEGGHVSVCIQAAADPIRAAERIRAYLANLPAQA